MKRINSIIVGSIFAILIMGGTSERNAQAQQEEPGSTFSVPFAFSANGHRIPAGTYRIALESNQFAISIRNLKTGDIEIFTVHPGEAGTVAVRGRLVFRRCGATNVLAEIHSSGTNEYSETIAPRQRSEAEAKTCSDADTVTVATR